MNMNFTKYILMIYTERNTQEDKNEGSKMMKKERWKKSLFVLSTQRF